jgi:ketosteroid isomerase-like protein
MSQENVETAQRVFANFNRRDKAAWLADNDPGHEIFPPKEWPENAPVRGAEACWDFYVENSEAFEQGDFELPELIDAGSDKVIANQHREMRGKSSGARIVYDLWIVMTFRDGKQSRADWFSTRAEALKAAGLSK